MGIEGREIEITGNEKSHGTKGVEAFVLVSLDAWFHLSSKLLRRNPQHAAPDRRSFRESSGHPELH